MALVHGAGMEAVSGEVKQGEGMGFFAKKIILSSLRAERARAVTVSQCPHSEVGQDFLLRRRVTLTETAVTRKQKVKKWIRRCQIDRLREGYKRAIDEIRGPIAKNGFSGRKPKILAKNNPLLDSNHVPATTGQCCPKKKYPFPK